MSLPKISQETLKFSVLNYDKPDSSTARELYKVMFKQQPALKFLIEKVITIEESRASESFKDGYCKGMLQCWSLLHAQAEIDELKHDDND